MVCAALASSAHIHSGTKWAQSRFKMLEILVGQLGQTVSSLRLTVLLLMAMWVFVTPEGKRFVIRPNASVAVELDGSGAAGGKGA